MNTYFKAAIVACLLAGSSIAVHAEPAPRAAALREKKAKLKAKVQAFSPAGYLKQKAVHEAVDSTSAPGQDATAKAPELAVTKTVDCQPEERPVPCEPGDASCDRVEIEPTPVTEGASVGNVPQGDDMAKTLFKKVRERCRPPGNTEEKSFEPVLGVSIAPPSGSDSDTGSTTTKVFNMGRRVGATVGFKTEF